MTSFFIKEIFLPKSEVFFSRETYPHTTNPHDSYHFFYWTRIILALFTGDIHILYFAWKEFGLSLSTGGTSTRSMFCF